jgi:hypothetical protein
VEVRRTPDPTVVSLKFVGSDPQIRKGEPCWTDYRSNFSLTPAGVLLIELKAYVRVDALCSRAGFQRTIEAPVGFVLSSAITAAIDATSGNELALLPAL